MTGQFCLCETHTILNYIIHHSIAEHIIIAVVITNFEKEQKQGEEKSEWNYRKRSHFAMDYYRVQASDETLAPIGADNNSLNIACDSYAPDYWNNTYMNGLSPMKQIEGLCIFCKFPFLSFSPTAHSNRVDAIAIN